MWAMLVFFCWILFFMLLFRVFGDLFSRHDLSGWGKAGWSIFVILLPFLGIFVYLIATRRAWRSGTWLMRRPPRRRWTAT